MYTLKILNCHGKANDGIENIRFCAITVCSFNFLIQAKKWGG